MDLTLPPLAPALCFESGATATHAMPAVLPVILAGGSGTRLWPLSREAHPKQLLALLGERSLLQSALARLDGTANASCNSGLLVCGTEHRFLALAQMGASTRQWRMLVEPIARNTAPALTLAALDARAGGDDPILVVMPADHAITDVDAFERAVSTAVELARQNLMVTLGVVPTRAETGYGYIETGDLVPGGDSGARTLLRFVEKPSREIAETFVAGGNHCWNSGIFVMRASVWLHALRALRPDIAAVCDAAFAQSKRDGEAMCIDPQAFAACPSESIDYAVMEHLAQAGVAGAVVPFDGGWSDLGSWDAVWDALPKDEAGNVTRGDVLLDGTSGTYVHSEGRLIACVGASDMIVVETADAVLVADRKHAQDVKSIVNSMRNRKRAEAEQHRLVHRPWGHYDSIAQGARFQVKRIVVLPGAALSLQLHYHRAEHWIVVSGVARVTRGDDAPFLLGENQSTYVPLGVMHRLENPGRVPLEMIEVQCGSYLGEDDIVRFNDRYGRA